MSLKNKIFNKLLQKSNTFKFYKGKYEILARKVENQNTKIEIQKNKIKLLNSKIKTQNKKIRLNDSTIKKYLENNNDLKKQLDDNFESIDEKLNLFENQINHIIFDNLRISKEIFYANVFNNTINGSNWLKNDSFSLINGAANYSFMYLLYRILDELKPNNILELGLGQTTKLTTQYVHNNPKTNLLVIESDKNWIENFSKNLNVNENITIKNASTEDYNYKSTKNIRYSNLKNVIKDKKFNLIIIDGPLGMNQDYPRTNIWNIANGNLNNDFIIIFDDYERNGEKNTADKLLKILDAKNIKYSTVKYKGINEQFIICTDKFKSVLWF